MSSHLIFIFRLLYNQLEARLACCRPSKDIGKARGFDHGGSSTGCYPQPIRQNGRNQLSLYPQKTPIKTAGTSTHQRDHSTVSKDHRPFLPRENLYSFHTPSPEYIIYREKERTRESMMTTKILACFTETRYLLSQREQPVSACFSLFSAF